MESMYHPACGGKLSTLYIFSGLHASQDPTRLPTDPPPFVGGAEHPNGTSQNHSNHWELDGEPEVCWSNPDLHTRVARLVPKASGLIGNQMVRTWTGPECGGAVCKLGSSLASLCNL
jgi:hypothetical protein